MSDRRCPIIRLPGGRHVNFLREFPNTGHSARNVFCHRHEAVRKQSDLQRRHEDAMEKLFDFDAWAEWIRSLDAAWLFLLILALVIAAVGFWSTSLRSEKARKPE